VCLPQRERCWLDACVISSRTTTAFIVGELLSNDLAIHAVAVVDSLERGLLLREGRVRRAGTVNLQCAVP
jgi:hypothetical protein